MVARAVERQGGTKVADSVSFGPFVFYRVSRTLARDGSPVSLGTRAAAILEALLDGHGAAVGKDRLIEAGWPGLVVEEGNLSVQIAGLRKALRARADGPDWIATVPRVGYRLVHNAEPSQGQAGQLPSVAVLPFQNLSGDPEQDYFADGMVEDIITALSRFRSFAVVARNSSFVYKGRAVDVRQVARDLGVRYVLEGSVRRAGKALRISAQLVEGSTGTHLWARTFDGGVDDVFEFQDRLAESIVGTVEPHMQLAEIERSRRERPEGIEAYDFYLRAVAKFRTMTAGDVAAAYSLAERGIEADPEYAPGYFMAARALSWRIAMGWPALTDDDRGRCIELTHQAMAKAAGDPPILASCATILLHLTPEHAREMLTVNRAVEANPNNIDVLIVAGIANLHCGSAQEALTLCQRALRLAPGDPTAHHAMATMAHAYMILENYDAALEWGERSLAVNDRNDSAYWMTIAANAKLGRLDEAMRRLAIFRALSPNVTISSIRAGQPSGDQHSMAAIFDGLRLAGLPEA